MSREVHQKMVNGKWWPPLSHFDAIMGCGVGCMGYPDPAGCDEHRREGKPYPHSLFISDDTVEPTEVGG